MSNPPPSGPPEGWDPTTPAGPPPGYGQPPAYGPPSTYGQPPAYGQPAYGQPAYGQPAYGYGTIDHPQGTTILILGICSLVFCGILGPVAWVMGNNALREIDASPGRYGNRGNVQAGRICGIITSVLLALGVALFAVLLIAGAASSSSS